MRIASFDAADTLIGLKEPVPVVYQSHAARLGITSDTRALGDRLKATFGSLPPPDYPDFYSGEEAERVWWRTLVFEAFAHRPGQSPRQDRVFSQLFDDLWDHYAQPEAWFLYEDTLPALEAARDRTDRLVVVSNFDSRLFPLLDHFGVTDFFDLIVNSAAVRSRKPDPGIFLHTLNLLNASPADCFHVGDNHLNDVQGARAAGLNAFHLTRPTKSLLDFVATLPQ